MSHVRVMTSLKKTIENTKLKFVACCEYLQKTFDGQFMEDVCAEKNTGAFSFKASCLVSIAFLRKVHAVNTK